MCPLQKWEHWEQEQKTAPVSDFQVGTAVGTEWEHRERVDPFYSLLKGLISALALLLALALLALYIEKYILHIHSIDRRMTMPVTRVFQSGNSQAVRLPKEFRFQEEEVVIKRVGDAVMLFPMRYAASVLKAELDALDADFQIERNQPKETQTRDLDS